MEQLLSLGVLLILMQYCQIHVHGFLLNVKSIIAIATADCLLNHNFNRKRKTVFHTTLALNDTRNIIDRQRMTTHIYCYAKFAIPPESIARYRPAIYDPSRRSINSKQGRNAAPRQPFADLLVRL